jgi:hypothetical protein
MNITIGQLKRLIKEEIENLHEGQKNWNNSRYLDSEGNDFSGMHDHDRIAIEKAQRELVSAFNTLGSSSNDAALRARAKDSILYGGGNPSEENIIKTMAWLKSVGG